MDRYSYLEYTLLLDERILARLGHSHSLLHIHKKKKKKTQSRKRLSLTLYGITFQVREMRRWEVLIWSRESEERRLLDL